MYRNLVVLLSWSTTYLSLIMKRENVTWSIAVVFVCGQGFISGSEFLKQKSVLGKTE